MKKEKRKKPITINPEPEKEQTPEIEKQEPETNQENPEIALTEIKENISDKIPVLEIAREPETEQTPEPIQNIETKKRGRPKGSKNNVNTIKENNDLPPVSLFMSDTIGELILNGYIKGILKSENLAVADEIKAFTESLKSVLDRYLPDTVKQNSDLLSLTLVLTSVTVQRLDGLKKKKPEYGLEPLKIKNTGN